MIVGPLLPAVLGIRAVVQVVDLGADGPITRVPLSEVRLRAGNDVEVKVLGPSLVELSVRQGQEPLIHRAVAELRRPKSALPECTLVTPGCVDAMVRAHPLYNRQAAPWGTPHQIRKPPPRWVWLLGMMLGLAGLALVVLALPALPVPTAAQRRALVAAGALLGGAVAGAAGWHFSGRVQQLMVFRPLYRPLLPEEFKTTDRLVFSLDAAGVLGSAELRQGLHVNVTATPDGADVTVYVEGPGPGELSSFETRVRGLLLEPQLQLHSSFTHLLDAATAQAPSEATALELLRPSLVLPSLRTDVPGPDARGPLNSAAAGAAAGALVMWAVAASPRRRRGQEQPSRS